jgi:hypothetical protein
MQDANIAVGITEKHITSISFPVFDVSSVSASTISPGWQQDHLHAPGITHSLSVPNPFTGTA